MMRVVSAVELVTLVRMEKTMHILVTNDDGVAARGLLALAQALREIPDVEVSVLAPERDWSVTGHVKTLNRPLRVWEVSLADGSLALATDGSPSDCVALALLGLLEKPVDLVVSGINPNPNIGHDITYSGTVTAAMEAVIAGVPAVAVSLDRQGKAEAEVDYRPAARAAQRMAMWVLANGLPPEVLLNVNVPALPEDELQGLQLTRLGRRVYRDRLVRRMDPAKRPYYWIGGEEPTGVPEEGTDIGALARGYISVTPLQMDMTAYRALEGLKALEEAAKLI